MDVSRCHGEKEGKLLKRREREQKAGKWKVRVNCKKGKIKAKMVSEGRNRCTEAGRRWESKGK
jgi:hypothetical protein